MNRCNNRFIGIILFMVSLVFIVVGCSKMVESSVELDRKEFMNILKDFGYRENNYNYKKSLKDGTIKLEFKNGAFFILDKHQKLIHADMFSTLEFEKGEISSFYPDKSYVEKIKNKYVPSNYTEVEKGNYSKDYDMYSFYKANVAHIFNPYDQIRIVFDNKRNAVILYDRFEEYKIENPPKIKDVEAEKIGRIFLTKVHGKPIRKGKNITLNVLESNTFFKEFFSKRESKENVKIEEPGTLHLAYSITYGDFMVFIDAYDGSIIGGDSF